MSSKHYNRALRVYKLMPESLERLLLNVFQSQEESGEALSDEIYNLILVLLLSENQTLKNSRT